MPTRWRPWLGLLALATLLGGCPSEAEDTQASAQPNTGLGSPPAAPAAASSLPAPPELPTQLKADEALTRAQKAGYVLGAGLSPLPGGKTLGAYLESHHRRAQPKALLLVFQGPPNDLHLNRALPDPSASDWAPLLLDGDLAITNQEVEERVIAFVGPGGLGLLPTGERGERWEAEGGWRLALQPGASATLVGPKGDATLPLQGRLGEQDRVVAVYVSPNGKALGLVERLPHSGLNVAHLLALDPQTKTFGPARFEH